MFELQVSPFLLSPCLMNVTVEKASYSFYLKTDDLYMLYDKLE